MVAPPVSVGQKNNDDTVGSGDIQKEGLVENSVLANTPPHPGDTPPSMVRQQNNEDTVTFDVFQGGEDLLKTMC